MQPDIDENIDSDHESEEKHDILASIKNSTIIVQKVNQQTTYLQDDNQSQHKFDMSPKIAEMTFSEDSF